jgi:hypothetical protein
MRAVDLPSMSPGDAAIVARESDELCPYIERARPLHGHASRNGGASTPHQDDRRADELLDTLWRKRSHRS